MKCRVCGLEEAEHHDFDPEKVMPAGCVCDPGTWGETVEESCAAFRGKAREYCSECEHDKACHAKEVSE